MAWLSGWNYRQSHVITHAAGAGSNYQVKILVHSGSGSSSGNDVYLDGKCTDFPNDIDFTDDSGDTELKFWIEDLTTNPITVWVKVTGDLTTVDQTIYIYYSKSNQSSLIDGDNTFDFFDHFLGTELDSNKWVINTGTPTISVAGSILTISYNSGTEHGIKARSGGTDLLLDLHHAIRTRMRDTSTYYYYCVRFGFGDYDYLTTLAVHKGIYTQAQWCHMTQIIGYRAISGAFNDNDNYYIWDLTWDTNRSEMIQSGTSKSILTTYIPSGTPLKVIISAFCNSIKTSGSLFDWFLVRNYVYPEPANSTWGDEEIVTLPTSKIFVVDKDSNLFRINLSDLTEEKKLAIT